MIGENAFQITYLRSREKEHTYFRQYDCFPFSEWDSLEKFFQKYEYAMNGDLYKRLNLEFIKAINKLYRHKTIIQYPIFNGTNYIGGISVIFGDRKLGCSEQRLSVIRKASLLLAPYLERKAETEKSVYDLRIAMNYDPLTGLPNMTYFKSLCADIPVSYTHLPLEGFPP